MNDLKFKTITGAKRFIEDVCPVLCEASIRQGEHSYTIGIIAPLDVNAFAVVTGSDLTALVYKAVELFGESVGRSERRREENAARTRMYERARDLCNN